MKLKLPVLILSLSILVQINGQIGGVSSGKPSYGEGFPALSVDYFGLLKLNELSPPDRYASQYTSVVNGDSDELVDEMLALTETPTKDIWPYLLLVLAADQNDRIHEVANKLRQRSNNSLGLGKNEKILLLASLYADTYAVSRPKEGEANAIGLNPDHIKSLTTITGRASVMMLVSVQWVFINANVVRPTAYDFLQHDPDFYQLRTFYARSLARGASETVRSDGTVIPGTGFSTNLDLLQHQIQQVIAKHPEYAPAYYVAIGGSSTSNRILFGEKFLAMTDPACSWHVRTKAYLERIKWK